MRLLAAARLVASGRSRNARRAFSRASKSSGEAGLVAPGAGEPAQEAPQPGEGALHNPAFGQHGEATIGILLHDFQLNAIPATPQAQLMYPVSQLTAITAVSPDLAEPPVLFRQRFQDRLGAITVLFIGRVDMNDQDQTQRIDQDMAFSARYLLPSVITARPPFSVVLAI